MPEKFTTLCIGIALAMSLACCAPKQDFRSAQGAVWGTTYHITYKADKDLGDSIIARMQEVELSLSPFNPHSLISQINNGDNPVADSALITVFNESQRVCALSGGAFDPTVAPLVNLWGFGYKNSSDPATAPSQEQIDSALALVGIADCGIDAHRRILKKSPRTEFNFSAITKGYGVDCVAQMLRRNGCHDFMVEIGGEVALSGLNPKSEKWHIQIDAPVAQRDTVTHQSLTLLELTDCAIATSGNYRNYRALADGSIASHTISTATGRPVATNTLSATVIAPSAMTADALATAAMAMPADKALEMLENEPHVEALLVTADTGNQFNILKTSAFPVLNNSGAYTRR